MLFGHCQCCPPIAASSVSRRRFLAGGAAALTAGAFAALPFKATAQANPHRIDVHFKDKRFGTLTLKKVELK